MKSRYSLTAITIYLVTCGAVAETADAARILQNDPFERPELIPLRPTIVANDSKPIREIWFPELRATMRGNQGAMANINGDIIKIGEKIDGFKLVELYERDAFFIKDGMKYHVSMDQEADTISQY